MIWKIVRKEFISHVTSKSFAVCITLTIIIVSANTHIVVGEFKSKFKNFQLGSQRQRQELTWFKTYSGVRGWADRPPSILSVYSRGVEDNVPNFLQIAPWIVPGDVSSGLGGTDTFLAEFSGLDITFIVTILMSLLAILLSYDAISGERESQTLKIVLSTNVSKSSFIIGKYLGALLPLASSIAIAIVIPLVFFELSNITLSFDDLAAVGLTGLTYVIYLSAYLLLGIWISTSQTRSSTSLIILLIVWVLCTAVIPNASQFMTKNLIKVRSPVIVSTEVKAIKDDYNRISRNEGAKLGLDKEFTPRGNSAMWNGYFGWDTIVDWTWVPERKISSVIQLMGIVQPLRVSYANRIDKILTEHQRRVRYQSDLSLYFGRLSPNICLENASNTFIATGFDAYEEFLKSSRRYRETLISFLQSNNAFNSAVFFLRKPNEAPKEFGGRIPGWWANFRPLDPSSIPQYTYMKPSLVSRLQSSTTDVGILILENCLFFLFAYFTFVVRQSV